jgi:hypothetical protein
VTGRHAGREYQASAIDGAGQTCGGETSGAGRGGVGRLPGYRGLVIGPLTRGAGLSMCGHFGVGLIGKGPPTPLWAGPRCRPSSWPGKE